MRATLIGEANPYGGAPHYALYPDPVGCAGHRLCYKVLQTDYDTYLREFDRVNLCPRAWKMSEARARATLLIGDCRPTQVLVLLGRKVATAFDCQDVPAFDWTTVNSARIVSLPHPSGLSRAWNEPGAFDRARALLKNVGVTW